MDKSWQDMITDQNFKNRLLNINEIDKENIFHQYYEYFEMCFSVLYSSAIRNKALSVKF